MTTISAAAPSTEGGGVNRIMITASVMMATTVIITDMTIATIALPHMQGGLSANQDQVSWVMTIYFMMQGVSMSTVGWVAGRFGRKRVFMCTLVGFVICAMLSGQAESISEIMFYRALQGMFSAPVVPISQALMLDSYPRDRHSQALAIWGTGVMFAPVMAPVIGGWLTDEYSWRFVFYVSSPFAILAILGVLTFVRETPRNLERRFDWFGFVSLAMALVSLQFMLDRGQSEGWFSSDFIVCAGVLIVLGIYLFVVHSLTTDNPFISSAIFADRNLVIGQKASRTMATDGTELVLHPDLTTPAASDINETIADNERVMWLPVDSRTFPPQHVDPGDQVSFRIPEFGSSSGSQRPTAGSGEIIGPFRILALGNRKGRRNVRQAAGLASGAENVIAIAVQIEQSTGKLEVRAETLAGIVATNNFQGVQVLLHKRTREQ